MMVPDPEPSKPAQLEFNNASSDGNNHGNQVYLMDILEAKNYVAGEVCLGKFTSIENDFTPTETAIEDRPAANCFQNQTHWSFTKREKVKKFRFVVCTLALVALALSVMSRMLFNISIVEMTKDVSAHLESEMDDAEIGAQQIPQVVKTIHLSEDTSNQSVPEIVSVFTVNDSDDDNPEAGLHFSWSVKATNFLLSAFFIGYSPSMFFSGGIAEQYGSMVLLSICVFGSALINTFTPYMAASSYYTLAASRIALGVLQGPLVPVCYDLFNKWLTATEMSFFVPLIKVSMAVGTLSGTLLPGVVIMMGRDWTYNFYIGGFICIVWLTFWFPLASSTPQTNRWIDGEELRRILRKKSTALAVIKLDNKHIHDKVSQDKKPESSASEPKKASIPWISIVTSPSVLVLTFVKFTYNLGMDFLYIMSAIYLSTIHDASTETIALISGIGCLMQMALVTLVGGLATYLVRNETFGLSRTVWRKIFQGTANFATAIIFYLIPKLAPGQIELVSSLFILIYFFWMFGAGGETMVPYDLSQKYPATIMGFAHSLSILSGCILPSVCTLVLGDDKKDPSGWNSLFLLISGSLALGGVLFVLMIKAKPILAAERAKYDQTLAKEKSLRDQNDSSRQ